MMKKVMKTLLALAMAFVCGGAWAEQILLWQNTTSGCTSETTVFRGITLKELMTKEVAAQMGGKQGTYIGTNGSVPFHALPVEAPNKSGEYIVQFQIIDGNYLKWANVKFVEAIDNGEPVIKATQLGNDNNTYNTGFSDNNAVHARERLGLWMGKGATYVSDKQAPSNYLLTKLYVVPQLTATITADVTDWNSITWDNGATWPTDGCADAVLTVAEGSSFSVNASSEIKPYKVTVVGGGTLTLGANVKATIACAEKGTITLPNAFAGSVEIRENGTYDIHYTGGVDDDASIFQHMTINLNGGAIANKGTGQTGAGKVQFQHINLKSDSKIDGTQNFFSIASGYGKKNIYLNGHTLTKNGANEYIMRTPNFVGGGTIDICGGKVKLFDPKIDSASDAVKTIVRSDKTLVFGTSDSKGGASFTGSFDIENYGTVSRENNYNDNITVRNLKNAGALNGPFTVKGLYEEAGTPIYTGTLTVTPTTTFRFPAESTSMTITCGTLELAEGMATTINSVQAYVGDESKLVNLTYDTTNKSVSYTVVRDSGTVYLRSDSNYYTDDTEGSSTQTTLIDGDVIVIGASHGDIWQAKLPSTVIGHTVELTKRMNLKSNIPAGLTLINNANVDDQRDVYMWGTSIGAGAKISGSGQLYMGYDDGKCTTIEDGVSIGCELDIGTGRAIIINGTVSVTGDLINSGTIKLNLNSLLKVPAGTNIGTISSNVFGLNVLHGTEGDTTTYYLGSASVAATVGADVYTSFDDALTAANSIAVDEEHKVTITLTKDCSESADLGEFVTLDPNGKSYTGTLTGSGTYILRYTGGSGNMPTAPAGVTAADWTGTVWVIGDGTATNANDFNKPEKLYSHSGSKLAMTGLDGYFKCFGGGTVAAKEVKLYDAASLKAFVVSDGTGSNGFLIKKLTGTGTLADRNNGPAGRGVSIEDASEFEGNIDVSYMMSVRLGTSSVRSGTAMTIDVYGTALLADGKTWTAPSGITVKSTGTIKGSGTLVNATTFESGATIDVSKGTLTASSTVTFGAAIKLVGTLNEGDTILSVATEPTALALTTVTTVNGEAVPNAHLYYEDGAVKYTTQAVAAWTPNTDALLAGDILDWTAPNAWINGSTSATWPTVQDAAEALNVSIDATKIKGVKITKQVYVGNVTVSGTLADGESFQFYSSIYDPDSEDDPVDGVHEVDATIDCLHAKNVNLTELVGELGMKVPITGNIAFGTETHLIFATGTGATSSTAYGYSFIDRGGSIAVEGAGRFVVPSSMYSVPFAVGNGATIVFDVANGEATSSAVISGSGSVVKKGTGTIKFTTANTFNGGLYVEAGEATTTNGVGYGPNNYDNNKPMSKITVSSGATLDLANLSGTSYDITCSGTLKNSGGDLGTGTRQTPKLTMSGNVTVNGNQFGLLANSWGATSFDMGGNTLTVSLNRNKNFILCNTTIKNPGLIDVTSNTIELYSAKGNLKIDASTVTFPNGVDEKDFIRYPEETTASKDNMEFTNNDSLYYELKAVDNCVKICRPATEMTATTLNSVGTMRINGNATLKVDADITGTPSIVNLSGSEVTLTLKAVAPKKYVSAADVTKLQLGDNIKLAYDWNASRVISLNFGSDRGNSATMSGDAIDGTLGGNVKRSAWENLSGRTGTDIAITKGYQDGTTEYDVADLSVSWAANGTYDSQRSDGTTVPFMHGYLDDSNLNTTPTSITIKLVPFKSYDLVVYYQSDTDDAVNFSPLSVTAGGVTTVYGYNDARELVTTGYNDPWGHAKLADFAYGENTMRITGLTTSSAVTLIPVRTAAQSCRSSIAAIQIVQMSTDEEDSRVASITADGETTYYTTLADAATHATSGQTIDLLASVKLSADVTLPEGVTLDIPSENLIVDANSRTFSGAVSGAGKIKFAGFAPIKDATTLKTSLQDEDNWTGSLVITQPSSGQIGENDGTVEGVKTLLNNFGNINSKIEFNNCTGTGNINYIGISHNSNSNPTVIQPEIVVTGDLKLNNGYTQNRDNPNNYTIIRKLSGTGSITGGGAGQVYYIVDGSAFAGSITTTAKKFVFGNRESTDGVITDAIIAVKVGKSVAIAPDKTWSANAIVVNGTLTKSNGATLTGSNNNNGKVSGSGEIIVVGSTTAAGIGGHGIRGLTETAWTGTFTIKDWNGADGAGSADFGGFGNVNSTVRFDGYNGYFKMANYNQIKAYDIAAGGLTLIGNYSTGTPVFKGNLIGSGSIAVNATGGRLIKFVGDHSGYTGTITVENTACVALVDSADAPVQYEAGKVVYGAGSSQTIPEISENETVTIAPGSNATVTFPEEATPEQKAAIAEQIVVKYGNTVLNPAEGTKYVEVSINQESGKVELTTTDAAKPAETDIAMATPTVETQDKVQFTITNPIPGLFYAVSSCDEPNGDFVSATGDQATSGDAKTVSIPMTFTDGKKVKYYKVSVKATK